MENRLLVKMNGEKNKIDRMIYGHFIEHIGTCIYGGIWVGEDSPIPNTRGIRNDVVEALREIKVPCIRWPGGCFAEEYHWENGIGPRESRPKTVNLHWGKVIESNHFGTHEFFDLCEQVGAEPYICGNMAGGTVYEMQRWIEYITYDGPSQLAELRRKNGREKPWKLKYFGIGNENWGCGGRMRAEYYADEFNRYSAFIRSYGDEKLYLIATGPRNDNYYWTEVLMRECRFFMDGLALHYYTRLGDPVIEVIADDGKNRRYLRDESRKRGSATVFTEKEWFLTMKAAIRIEEIIKRNCEIMDKYDPEKKVALVIDEWGTWFDCEEGTNPSFLFQQNTLRDALVAGLSLNIFNNNSERVRMTNIAQMVNVLQALIHTKDDKMVLTPTYHVFNMYKIHQDAVLLDFSLLSDDYTCEGETLKKINASVSKDKEGNINITLCNIDPNNPAKIICCIEDVEEIKDVKGKVLTSNDMAVYNTTEEPNNIRPEEFNDVVIQKNNLYINMPSKSIISLVVKCR